MNRTCLLVATLVVAATLGAGLANATHLSCVNSPLLGKVGEIAAAHGVYLLSRPPSSTSRNLVVYVESNGVPGAQTGGLSIDGSSYDACSHPSGNYDQLVLCADGDHCAVV